MLIREILVELDSEWWGALLAFERLPNDECFVTRLRQVRRQDDARSELFIYEALDDLRKHAVSETFT